MCKTTRGGEGYDVFEKFKEFMAENKVPNEAWNYKNIETLESNLLGGSGSPSFKAMAGEKLVVLSGMTAASPWQENAIQDEIAIYADRQNVSRYRNTTPDQIPPERREIGMENAALTNEHCNPENVPVLPTDNHLEHMKGHFSDAMSIANNVLQAQQGGSIKLDDLQAAHQALMYHGAQMTAHMQYLYKDPTKQNELKQLGQSMQQLQKMTDQIGSAAQQMAQKQQDQQGQSGSSPEDQKLQSQVAMDALAAKHKQEMDQLKLGSKAQLHELTMQQKKGKAATDLAVKRAEAEQKMKLEGGKAVHEAVIKQGTAIQDANITKQEADQQAQINAQEAIQMMAIDAQKGQSGE